MIDSAAFLNVGILALKPVGASQIGLKLVGALPKIVPQTREAPPLAGSEHGGKLTRERFHVSQVLLQRLTRERFHVSQVLLQRLPILLVRAVGVGVHFVEYTKVTNDITDAGVRETRRASSELTF
jgi:hypothetical protein